MQEIEQLDPLDCQIVAALALDGRVGFRLLADILGVSDQTVSRRYSRLRSTGRARVLATTSTEALRESQWYLRAQCTPNSATAISEALARRADTSWVTLISGGTEVVCSTRAKSLGDTEHLLLEEFPRTPRVLGVTAQCELQVFTRGDRSFMTKTGALNLEQSTAILSHVAKPGEMASPGKVPSLDETDESILHALAKNGRLRAEDVGTQCSVSAATAARRISRLRQTGILDLRVDVDPAALGVPVRTLAWLSIAPNKLDAAAEQLAKHPQAGFVAATTGRTNLYASFFTADVLALYRFLTGDVSDLPGLRDMETALAIRRTKRF